MNGDAFIKGLVALDSNGKIWLGWGRTLASYDPDSDTFLSWALPSYSNVAYANMTVSDGRMVALALGSDGEVWVAVKAVQALFGFNKATHVWDRTVLVPFIANEASRLAEPHPGMLILSGAVLGPQPSAAFAKIDLAAGVVTQLSVHAIDFVLLPNNELVYVDAVSDVPARFNLSNSSVMAFAAQLPVAHAPDLVLDSTGKDLVLDVRVSLSWRWEVRPRIGRHYHLSVSIHRQPWQSHAAQQLPSSPGLYPAGRCL